MPRDDDPRLNGLKVFGDTPSFSIAVLVDTPASIDTFLGNAPGTTVGVPQSAYALSGVFYGSSSSAVQQQINTLSAMEGLTCPFGYPTGLRFPDDFRWAPHWCYFLPQEFVPGSIQSSPGNQWKATFRIVLRQCR